MMGDPVLEEDDFLSESIDEFVEGTPLTGDIMPASKEALARVQRLSTALTAQHAMHGILASVFERVGGEDFIVRWATDHPGPFIKLLVGATPGLQPQTGFQGDVNLHIHHTLAPSKLDE